jgi:hypothetical protein
MSKFTKCGRSKILEFIKLCYLNNFKKETIERRAISVGEVNTVKNTLVRVIKGDI